MYCPKCGYEYEEGIQECTDCKAPLIDSLPKVHDPHELVLVTVFESSDPAVLDVVQSLFDEAGITFTMVGDRLQDIIAGGRLAGINPLTGPVKVQVNSEDAEDARALLADLDNPTEGNS